MTDMNKEVSCLGCGKKLDDSVPHLEVCMVNAPDSRVIDHRLIGMKPMVFCLSCTDFLGK